MRRYYAGWSIYGEDESEAPITGSWVAVRFGVSIRARTESELISMIDLREAVDEEFNPK